MNSTRPSSASRLPQRLPELLEPISSAHARATPRRRSRRTGCPGSHENTSATSKLTFADRTRSRAISTASGAASIAVTVSAQPRQRLRPQASPARDLQHASGWPHLRDQSRDTCTSRRDVAVRRCVVLARPATVVINLISQDLVSHPASLHSDATAMGGEFRHAFLLGDGRALGRVQAARRWSLSTRPRGRRAGGQADPHRREPRRVAAESRCGRCSRNPGSRVPP